jgi:phenylalanyl-tRNA synthetase beta chain
MRYAHQWLRSFVDHDRTPDAVRDLMSAHVATVDGTEHVRADLAAIVVGLVVEAAPHPDSDHLWVTRVDDGSGTVLDVVCGAPNVVAGTRYPFARTGTVMPNGMRIEKRKIRGAVSNGMLCSAREIGLGEDADGIMALDIDAAPGTPLLDAVPLGDVRFDVDVLPNRPDLLSHLGMARELAALTGVPLRMPTEVSEALSAHPVGESLRHRGDASATADGVTVALEDRTACPRYVAVVVRGVRVGPSPDWLVQRLSSVGARTVNNVVDATNYVLLGLGQPVHAFDLSKLAEQRIVVRPTREGESIVTLDGVTRTLATGTTVICDGQQPVALAGVMGGSESEVDEQTTDLLIEVAWFEPGFVRRVRRSVGLSTDASYRFERSVDPQFTADAARCVAALVRSLAGGRATAMLDVGKAPEPPATIGMRPTRIARLIGDDLAEADISTLLTSIGFTVARAGGDALSVTPPSWRADVLREADLAEEVARLRGYDRLSDELAAFRPGTMPDSPLFVASNRVRAELVAAGLMEVRPIPFVAGDDETHARVLNPLAEDEPHLRTNLLETLARRAEYNLTRMQGNVRLFEIGSAFEKTTAALPREELRVAALIMGARRPVHFTEPQPPSFDEWDVKALAARIVAAAFAGETATLTAGTGDLLWTVQVGARKVGSVRRVALDRPAWASQAFGVEVTLDQIPSGDVAAPGTHAHLAPSSLAGDAAFVRYRPLPGTPAVEFDLALLLPGELPAAAVEDAIRKSAGDLLESLVLFDEYRGTGLPGGVRSVAWRLTFRDPVRTLREKEVEGRRQKILRTLEKELGVRQRTV